ncbi:MAG: replicative DNA helicase [Tenericutes bacterium]|nr:replicative DNA helicase [Mycoplasmatota bacterium]
MPQAIEIEQCVLGAMFLSDQAVKKCVENLTPDVFFLDAHRKIFEVMQNLSEQNIMIDAPLVIAELEKRGILDSVGGTEYLTVILNSVISSSNIDEHIKIVNEKAILRRLIDVSSSIIDNAYDGDNELSDVLENAETKILNVVKTRKGSEFKSIQDVLNRTVEQINRIVDNKGEVTGLSTGFTDLDKLTTGFHPHELIIIAARPAMGKTAFALNLATNIAQSTTKTVALFNMEMGAEQLAMRMIAAEGELDQGKLKRGELDKNDFNKIDEAVARLGNTNLVIDDTSGMTIGEIKAKCRRLASSENGLGIVIIDYLTLIMGSTKYQGNRQQEVSEISRSLKTMAMELDIPVVALAQLSRNVEQRDDKRPMLSDLRESGSIEQDADIVAFLYRDDYYQLKKGQEETSDISQSEFIVAKHRSGPTDTINLLFKRNISKFVSIVKKETENG